MLVMNRPLWLWSTEWHVLLTAELKHINYFIISTEFNMSIHSQLQHIA